MSHKYKDKDCHQLIKEIASYFYKSKIDNNFYLKEGYMFLPQKLMIKIMKYAQQNNS